MAKTFEQFVLNEARKATALPHPCVIGWPEQLQIARAIAAKVEAETRERCAEVCMAPVPGLKYVRMPDNLECYTIIRAMPSKYGEPK